MQHLVRVIREHQPKRKGEKLYTTAEAARQAGVSRQTVQAWIAMGKIKGPELILPVHIRLWSKEDVAQLKKVERRQARAKRREEGKKEVDPPALGK